MKDVVIREERKKKKKKIGRAFLRAWNGRRGERFSGRNVGGSLFISLSLACLVMSIQTRGSPFSLYLP